MAVIPLPYSPSSCLQLSAKRSLLQSLSETQRKPPLLLLSAPHFLLLLQAQQSPPKISPYLNVPKRTSFFARISSLQVTECAFPQRLLQIPSFTGVSFSLAHSIALAESIAASLEAARGS